MGRRAAVLGLGALVALAAAAAGRPAGQPAPPLPRLLSQTGLYDARGAVDPRNRPFSPQYPLWSDGATKRRWIRLPEGAAIDVSDLDAWRFPPGTRLWKEFSWGGRKVETRMIVRTGDDWLFATYAWNEEQTDGVLVPDAGVAGVEVAPGLRHTIPGTADCAACHRSSPAVVLGFSALQLSDDRDPMAPHAEPLPPGALTLRSLDAAGLLSPPRPDLVAHPPRIRERRPSARAALGYLSANCGGCHNASGPLGRLGLTLLHDAAAPPSAREPASLTTLDVPGRWRVPGIPPERSRIVAPGAPEASALLVRMTSRRPSSQMPPLGTATADEEAVALVTRWIEELGTEPPALR